VKSGAITYRVTDQASLCRVPRLPRNASVVFDLPKFSGEVTSKLEKKVNHLIRECGCRMAAIFLFPTMMLCIALDILNYTALLQRPFRWAGINWFACTLAVFAGKALGIAVARWKLHRLIRKWVVRLSAADSLTGSNKANASAVQFTSVRS
jgi:hypothetical protein